MKSDLEQIREEINQSDQKVNSLLSSVWKNILQISEEYWRVHDLYNNAGVVIDEIDRDFQEKTHLNQTDMIFLFLAVALQCARQYVLTNDKLRFASNTDGDVFAGGLVQGLPQEWQDVLLQGVPYDVVQRGGRLIERDYHTSLSGITHRYRTAGHDPLLGWIFGTSNILTNACTESDLITTYRVQDNLLTGKYYGGTRKMLSRAMGQIKRNPLFLPAAVGRQAIHFSSDYFTKQGLPIPLISTLNNDMAKKLIMEGNIDLWSVTRGATLSLLINSLVAEIHKLFYDSDKDGSPSIYKVRTRKILSYSNALASSSNIIVTAITGDLKKLDLGGILVTCYRLISDYRFIHQVKKEFLATELYDRVLGSKYDFLEEENNNVKEEL